MPKKNTDKIAERRVAREKQRQHEKDVQKRTELDKIFSGEEMNVFFESKEMVELCALHGIVIPKTNVERDRSWNILMSLPEFAQFARNFSYNKIDEMNRGDDFDYGLYMLALTHEEISNSIHHFFQKYPSEFFAHEWSAVFRVYILIHSLIVVRHQVSHNLLNSWKALVGL